MGASGGSSSSEGYGESQSLNWLNSFSDAFSRQTSDSSSVSGTSVLGQQLPFLTGLWGKASAAADPTAVTRAAKAASGAVIPGLDAAIKSTTALTDPTAQIKAQSASLKAGLGDLFRTEINPAIQTDAIAAGGFGGGRQGVAEGVATGQLADAFTQGLGDIVSSARSTALGAAGLLPGLSDARYQAGTLPTTAGMDVLGTLASIIGAPTLLSSARSTSTGRGVSGSTSQSAGGGRSRTVQSQKSSDARFGFNLI